MRPARYRFEACDYAETVREGNDLSLGHVLANKLHNTVIVRERSNIRAKSGLLWKYDEDFHSEIDPA